MSGGSRQTSVLHRESARIGTNDSSKAKPSTRHAPATPKGSRSSTERMYKKRGSAKPPRPRPPQKQESSWSVGQRVRVVRDGALCEGDVSFLSPLRDTCTITYSDKKVETFVSVTRLRAASMDGFKVLAAPEPKATAALLRWPSSSTTTVLFC